MRVSEDELDVPDHKERPDLASFATLVKELDREQDDLLQGASTRPAGRRAAAGSVDDLGDPVVSPPEPSNPGRHPYTARESMLTGRSLKLLDLAASKVIAGWRGPSAAGKSVR